MGLIVVVVIFIHTGAGMDELAIESEVVGKD